MLRLCSKRCSKWIRTKTSSPRMRVHHDITNLDKYSGKKWFTNKFQIDGFAFYTFYNVVVLPLLMRLHFINTAAASALEYQLYFIHWTGDVIRWSYTYSVHNNQNERALRTPAMYVLVKEYCVRRTTVRVPFTFFSILYCFVFFYFNQFNWYTFVPSKVYLCSHTHTHTQIHCRHAAWAHEHTHMYFEMNEQTKKNSRIRIICSNIKKKKKKKEKK